MSPAGRVTPEQARCTPLRLRRILGGYDPDRVDDLLDEVADALEAVSAGEPSPMTADDVVDAVLPRTGLGVPGYHPRQVDELLDRVADSLQEAA